MISQKLMCKYKKLTSGHETDEQLERERELDCDDFLNFVLEDMAYRNFTCTSYLQTSSRRVNLKFHYRRFILTQLHMQEQIEITITLAQITITVVTFFKTLLSFFHLDLNKFS